MTFGAVGLLQEVVLAPTPREVILTGMISNSGSLWPSGLKVMGSNPAGGTTKVHLSKVPHILLTGHCVLGCPLLHLANVLNAEKISCCVFTQDKNGHFTHTIFAF